MDTSCPKPRHALSIGPNCQLVLYTVDLMEHVGRHGAIVTDYNAELPQRPASSIFSGGNVLSLWRRHCRQWQRPHFFENNCQWVSYYNQV